MSISPEWSQGDENLTLLIGNLEDPIGVWHRGQLTPSINDAEDAIEQPRVLFESDLPKTCVFLRLNLINFEIVSDSGFFPFPCRCIQYSPSWENYRKTHRLKSPKSNHPTHASYYCSTSFPLNATCGIENAPFRGQCFFQCSDATEAHSLL